MKLTFIQTGGTIDKDYPRKKKGYAFEITEPAVKRILKKVTPNFEYEIVSVLKKDSLDLTAQDREKLYEACASMENENIIITHGTDTMIDTAEKLSTLDGKVIVLTGAMRPARFSNTDAEFNVGTAVGAINVLNEGVYIAMHGRIYAWDRVKRDPTTGQFEEKTH